MEKVTKSKLEEVLKRRLKLDDAQFRFERAGSRIVGDIVSKKFTGKRDHERQELIWDALEAEWGPDCVQQVGMLLAYTPDEWHLGEPEPVKTKRAG